MALKLVVDKLEDVAEAFRSLYVADGDKFRLDAEGIPDVGPLNKALNAERRRAEALEKKVSAWEKAGKTPEEIESLIAANTQAENEKLEKAGEWQKLRDQMNAEHAKVVKGLQDQIAAKDGEVKTIKSRMEGFLIQSQATAAIAAAKGVPELLLPHVQKHVKIVEEHGEPVLRVVDAQGGPRVNGKGEPLPLSDLITELKASDLYGRAFEGSGSSGSGAPPAGGGNGKPPSGKFQKRSDFKTEKERADYIDEHGLPAYQALPIS